MQNYYEILGVSPTATTKEIRWAYRRLAFVCHPDRNAQDPSAAEILKLANEAYHTLVDPESRLEYDEHLLGISRHRALPGAAATLIQESSSSILGMGMKETAVLSLALLGGVPVIFLSDLFLPQITFLTSLAEVWGLTLLAGGFSRATAFRTGLSRIEVGIAGITLGIFGATFWLHPEDNFLPFVAVLKIAAAAGLGGWGAGTLAGRFAGKLPTKSTWTQIALATFVGAVLGCLFGGLGSYVLSTGTLNEALLSSLAPDLVSAEYAAFLLGCVGGGTGGSVLATALVCRRGDSRL